MKRHTLLDPNVQKALESLPHIGSTDGSKKDRPAVKLFVTVGEAFWVVWEYDKESDIAFGLGDLGMGFPEIGSISIAEMRGNLAQWIERDTAVSTLVEGYESRNVPVPDYLVSR